MVFWTRKSFYLIKIGLKKKHSCILYNYYLQSSFPGAILGNCERVSIENIDLVKKDEISV